MLVIIFPHRSETECARAQLPLTQTYGPVSVESLQGCFGSFGIWVWFAAFAAKLGEHAGSDVITSYSIDAA
jgi:hypothetical protein